MEGLTEKHDIAKRFSQHYREMFNSVHYDEEEMSQLYHDVCSDVSECKDHDHCIPSDSVKSMKRGKSYGYDRLTSDYQKKWFSVVNMLYSFTFHLYSETWHHS